LLVVTVLSFAFRAALVDVYETMVLGLSKDESAEPSDRSAHSNENDTPAPTESDNPKETPVVQPQPPDVELPTFEKIDRKLPEEEPEIGNLVARPPDDKEPGYGYSRLETVDLSKDGAAKFLVKVVVPAHYKKADLLRVAASVLKRQRMVKPPHAVRFLFFTDMTRIADADAIAEIVWAPEGEFSQAADAVSGGTDDNMYRINMK
jgi:hypothetical protein